MIVHWSLTENKSPQVSKTLHSILNNAVDWIVSTCLPNSKSYSPFNNPLVTIPKAPITIGIIVTFMFHSFFQFPSKADVLILLFTFSQFYSVVSRDSQVHNLQIFYFFVDYYSGWISGRDSFTMPKSHGSFVCHFLGQMLGCAYTICSYGQI